MKMRRDDLLLREIPLFSRLTAREFAVIKEKSSFREYKKGEVIYREGSPPDAFYCVISGRVLVYVQGPGAETRLEYLHHGKYFGIISLLTGEAHSVTAQAINDSLLLVIQKDDFDLVLEKIPRLAIDLSRTLSRRLKSKDFHLKTIFESTVVSVFSSYSQAGKTLYALNLALSLRKETGKTVVILDVCPKDKMHSLPAKLELNETHRCFDLSGADSGAVRGIRDYILHSNFSVDLVCLHYDADDETSVKRLVDILSLLVNDYHYLLLDLPSRMDRPVFEMLNQSDTIHILTGPEPVDLKRTHNLISRLKSEFRFQEEKIKIIVNEYKQSRLTHEEQTGLLGHAVFATLPKLDLGASGRSILDEAGSEYALAVRRVARQVGDCLVGLALGVGVAYGFCHIGVLKVIEEEGIPIDVISGSSIGSVIAALWATGRSSEEILEITMREFKEPKLIWSLIDLTFPSVGFIKGKKMYNFIKKYLGDKTFYDLKLPLRIIASDVRRKLPIVLDTGSVADAVMASCTMPGVFRPFKFKEDILVDGGIINPLPTEALLQMGVKKIIAVNVTPSREDILSQYEKLKEQMAVTQEALKKRNWFDVRQYFKALCKTNILKVVFDSVELLQAEVIRKEAAAADIVLHPDAHGLYWLELHRSKEFAERGEQEARKHLSRIWQLIKE